MLFFIEPNFVNGTGGNYNVSQFDFTHRNIFPQVARNRMSIMSPHPTEKDNEDSQPESMESSTPSSDTIKINGNNSVAPSTNTGVGAKRRKPLKTNKVTQQLQVILYIK